MLTEHQAQIIAAALEELRPRDWRTQQVLDVLYENRDAPHNFKTLIQVAINAALNPNVKSPSGIFLPGKHWNLPEPPKNIPQGRPCQDHEGQQAHSCSACWADIKLGHRAEGMLGKRLTRPAKPTPPGEEYKRVKQQLRAARSHAMPRQRHKTPAHSSANPQNV